MAAAQFGSTKKIAAAGNTITVPKYEDFKTTAGQTSQVLEEVPVGTLGSEIPFIYTLNGDDTIGTAYEIGVAASSTKFALDAATKTITLPTGLTAGTHILVMYDYAAEAAVEVYNSAKDFPTAGKFVLEVVGSDVCDPSKKYYAYIIFPNAKLLSEVDMSFTTDGEHPFTLQANQQYCDTEKKLFRIVVPDAVSA